MIKRLANSVKGFKGIDYLPADVRFKLDKHIRIKAVDRAEEKILLSARDSNSFSDLEKQKLISRCEEQIIQEYKNGGMKLALAALGVGYFV